MPNTVSRTISGITEGKKCKSPTVQAFVDTKIYGLGFGYPTFHLQIWPTEKELNPKTETKKGKVFIKDI